MSTEVKYPNVKVRLTGADGNAFSIMGKVAVALSRAKVSSAEIALYRRESMSGDYDNVIQTAMKWVNIT